MLFQASKRVSAFVPSSLIYIHANFQSRRSKRITSNLWLLEYQSTKQMLRVVLLVFLLLVSAEAIRLSGEKPRNIIESDSGYSEASDYRNGEQCVPRLMSKAGGGYDSLSLCDPAIVHVAMTLDSEYLRGSVAAINSILRHASCPENIFFHFVASSSSGSSPVQLTRIVRSAFPSLNFKAYPFDEGRVKALISSSVRKALDNPLNYARSYLAEIIEQCVDRVVYLDSDVIVVDDIQKLWSVSLTGSRIIAAPEYCHVDIGKYFTGEFWSDSGLSGDFQGRKACYFNTGVMVIDLGKWRKGDYTKKIDNWMEIQRERRIYHLGSLPPFLLVFGGEVEGIDHRWNQHGLGGDNVVNSCRKLHPGPVSLLHWSGKGKPWVRLDEGRPCPVDNLWKPYDLYTSPNFSRQ